MKSQKNKKIEKPFEIVVGQYGEEFWIKTGWGNSIVEAKGADRVILLALDRIIDYLNSKK